MSEMQVAASGRQTVADGPFAGWWTWGHGTDPFETLLGGFYYRLDEQGRPYSAFQPRAEHCNGNGALHGGLLMTFVDFTLFALAHYQLETSAAVTLSCSTDFLSAGQLNARIEGYGEVTHTTKSLIFVQGKLRQAEIPVVSFRGILKKLHPRAA